MKGEKGRGWDVREDVGEDGETGAGDEAADPIDFAGGFLER